MKEKFNLFKFLKKHKIVVIVVSILVVVLITIALVRHIQFNDKLNDNLPDMMSVNDIASVDELSVGQHLKFGKYEQDGDESNGKEPIEWRVLAIEDGKALLLSEKLLDFVMYHNDAEEVTWEDCSLRKWMNGKFLRTAFKYDERKKIAKSKITNWDNPEYGTDGGKDTIDKIFALSVEDAEMLFDFDEERVAYLTDYALGKIQPKEVSIGYAVFDSNDFYMDSKTDAGSWWLRTPGKENYYTVRVADSGYIDMDDVLVFNNTIAVRPAMWIEL